MSRKPDFWVKAIKGAKGSKETSKVGAAWKNADGSISVDLNPFVVLQGAADLHVTLFPVERGTGTDMSHAERRSQE